MSRFIPFFFLVFIFACQNIPNEESPSSIQEGQIEPVEAKVGEGKKPAEEVEIESTYVPRFDYDTTEWLDIADLDQTIVLDIRYATNNNFVIEKMYDCPRCFLRPEVAKAVVEAHKNLQKKGLGLKMYDCYRPRPVQQKLWDKIPDSKYVANPQKGSMHNRGAAVDLTIVDENGEELEMGTAFDYFGKEAHHDYKNLPDSVLQNRKLLKATLYRVGLIHIRTEWWHYSYLIKKYPISDMLWNCN